MRGFASGLAIAAVAALSPQMSHAQAFSGVLIVSEVGAPVANARVWLMTPRGFMVDTTRSDAQGRFTVKADRPGTYVLNVRRLGYFPEETDPIKLASGQTVIDTVYLLSPQVLKPVDVVVKREVETRFGVNIHALSSSNVITPDEIDRYRFIASDLESLLRWSMPVSLQIARRGTDVCYMIRGRGCAGVYLDGLFVGTNPGFLSPHEIESIVVIPGSESFIRFGQSAGAIAIFTTFSSRR
jgi:hypothetical protein